MALTNWAAIAAKGTSYKVSIPSSEQISHTTCVELSKNASQSNQENDDSISTVLSSSGSTASSHDENSNPTATTTTNVVTNKGTTSKTNPVTYAGETVQVPVTKKQFVPAPTPAKNPWKIDEIIREREEKMDDLRASLSPDLLTPAESKDIKVAVKAPLSLPVVPSEKVTHNSRDSGNSLNSTNGGKNGSRKVGPPTSKSASHNHNTSQIQNQGKIVSTKKTLGTQGLSTDMKNASTKKSSIPDKSKLKMTLSPVATAQQVPSDVKDAVVEKNLTPENSDAINENTSHEPHKESSQNTSSITFEIKTTEVKFNSDSAATTSELSPAAPSSKKKSTSKQPNHPKSNISSNSKTKSGTSDKTKKNVSKKKNRSNKNRVELRNAFSYVLSPEEIEALKVAAVIQIEYFFTIDELVKNIYIRKHMDSDGFLPAALIFNFPSVLSYCIPYYDLLGAVDAHAKTIEVDFENECLRLKGGEAAYKKWLMPNPDGTMGCPKWIKESQQSLHESVADSVDMKRAKKNSNFCVEEEKKEDYECAPQDPVANADN